MTKYLFLIELDFLKPQYERVGLLVLLNLNWTKIRPHGPLIWPMFRNQNITKLPDTKKNRNMVELTSTPSIILHVLN